MKKFDAIIIGSGQAGTPLAFTLASKDQKVAFIEKEHVGGTCLNVGCTPTKAYVASARRMWEAQHGEDLGVNIPSGAKVDLKNVKSRKDTLIKSSVEGIEQAIEKESNITFYKGMAAFCGHKKLMINKEEIGSDTIYINVGSRPKVPEAFEKIPFLSSQSILELEKLPEHLIIIGGSYIGLEFGQMFRRFGSKVTIIEKDKTIIGGEDDDISETILKFMEAEGVDFLLNSECISANEKADKSIEVTLKQGKNKSLVSGSHLLLAVGRQANTDTLNLSNTGLSTNKNGYIEVNEYLETEIPGIFALGECNGRGAFTHTAYNDYEIIANNISENKKRKVSDRILTYALFVDPPLGRAGMSKKEALKKGYDILEAYHPMDKINRAKEKGETNGFMRAIVDSKTHKILGAAVLGTGGDEVISSLLNIMYANVPYQIFRDAVHPHPTITELIPTMLESLKEVNKQ
ncbi:MAG: mercuric reductase [Cyclobacteriaceae bacterium]